MTSPKNALKVAEAYFKTECLSRKCSESERELYQMIKAAIPVAELEAQAVELLIEDHNIALHGRHAQDWLTRRDTLLTQVEALK